MIFDDITKYIYRNMGFKLQNFLWGHLTMNDTI